MNVNEIPILDICVTFSGECSSVPVGTKILLVRVAGCNFNCTYCDTPDSKAVGTPDEKIYKLSDLVKNLLLRADKHNVRTIMFTGGEPMLYEQQLGAVIAELNSSNLPDPRFIIETNGSRFPDSTSYLCRASNITWCVDIKTFALEASKYGDELECFLMKADSHGPLAGEVIFKIPVGSIVDFNMANKFIREVATEHSHYLLHTTFMYCPIFNDIGQKDREGFVEQLSTNLIKFNPFTSISNMRYCEIGINFQMHKVWGFK